MGELASIGNLLLLKQNNKRGVIMMSLGTIIKRENTSRLEPKVWIGLVAAIVYVLLAGGLGNLLNLWFPTGSGLGDFAVSHFIPLIPLIVGGLFFVYRAGWSNEVFAAKPAYLQRPKRKWLYVFPALLLVQAVLPIFGAPWSEVSLIFFIVSLLATVLVGIGEELYFRGILRVSIQAHHGAFVTLVATSLLFGLGHTVGEVFENLPVALIVFQVSVLAMNGLLYFGAFLATGRLWVVMFLHFLTDFGLRINGGFGSSSDYTPGPLGISITIILGVFSFFLIISAIRQDILTGRAKRVKE